MMDEAMERAVKAVVECRAILRIGEFGPYYVTPEVSEAEARRIACAAIKAYLEGMPVVHLHHHYKHASINSKWYGEEEGWPEEGRYFIVKKTGGA